MNASPSINRRSKQHFDWQLFLIALILAGYGVLAITAATYSYTDDPLLVDTLLARITNSYYGARQGLFFLLSPIAIFGMAAFSYRIFQRFSGFLFIASLLLLIAVLVRGTTTSGVTGWFELFSGYMLQPSEFAKIAAIIHLAQFFARKENPVSNFREFINMGIIMMVPIALIFAQGELGTVMVFLFVYVVMMFMSGMSLRIIAALLVGVVLAMIPVVMYMQQSGSYRYDRIISFIDPSKASADAIYQQTNSQIAIGNGGIWGTGLFVNGTYTALNYVPQNHTDFIFSSIGETMGFGGCVIAILAFFYMCYRLLILSLNTQDKFARLVIIGIFGMMLFHILFNISMTIGSMPVMGIPLPFLSYGGSNLIANMASIGLVLNITLRKPMVRKNMAEGEGETMEALGKRGKWLDRFRRQKA